MSRAWSFRGEMLNGCIRIEKDNTRTCIHPDCGFHFAAGSDVSAWSNHYSVKHHAKWAVLQALKKQHSSRTISEVDDSVSIISSSSPAAAAAASTSSATSESRSVLSSNSSNKKQRTLLSMMKVKPDECLAAVARAFATNTIAYRVVETESFRNLLQTIGYTGTLPCRKTLRDAVAVEASNTQVKVGERLRDAVVTLAADGWTNVKRQKITNLVPMVNGVAYYWTSIVNTGEQTAEYLATELLPRILSLCNEYGARVVGLVVDNEAVNAAAHRLLFPKLPFLIHIPCAAHTIQLIVRSCLEKPEAAATVAQFADLVRFFDAKSSRTDLRKQQIALGAAELVVQKPCDTRWSSLFTSAQRMLDMEAPVINVCTKSYPAVKPEFWPKLRALVDFLKPFAIATDKIQRDSATLYTVYEQFIFMRAHADKYPWARGCINERWEKRIHVDAVTASAILSFTEPVGLNKQSAQRFIIAFGAAYISYFKLMPKPAEQVGDDLMMQLADFNGREGLFSELKKQIESAKRAAASASTKDNKVYFVPRKVWLLYSDLALGIVAATLLSISASEAAVERSFSTQGLIHSKRRNALNAASVEAEMMLKFNTHTLQQGTSPLFAGVIDMVEEAAPEDECAETVVPEPLQDGEFDEELQLHEEDDEVKEADLEEEPAASAASAVAPAFQRRRMQRQPSCTFATIENFVQWFIEKQNLTAASSITADTENALVAYSSRLRGMQVPGSATLRIHLSNALAALRK